MSTSSLNNTIYGESPVEIVAPTDAGSNYEYHYTLDNSIPTIENSLFTSNITLNYGDNLKIRKFRINNETYHPSPIMTFSNYTPTIVLEECCNLYDQLVWEGNSNKINTFWNNQPLNIKYYIRKIHDTYFLFIDPLLDRQNNFYNNENTSDDFSSLDNFYCKASIFYSKNMKDWTPLSGFENDFSNPINLRGKLSSNYPVDIFYYENKFHIVYIKIDPVKLENFLFQTYTAPEGSTAGFGSKFWRRVPAYNNNSVMLYPESVFEGTGYNSTETLSIYDRTVENLDNLNSSFTDNIVYENLEQNSEITDYLDNKAYFDSRFLFLGFNFCHLLTNHRMIFSISWRTAWQDKETLKHKISYNAALLSKHSKETRFSLLKTYSSYATAANAESSTVGERIPGNKNFKLEACYEQGYYIIPFIAGSGSVTSSTWQGQIYTWYTRSFNMETIKEKTSYPLGDFKYPLLKDNNNNFLFLLKTNSHNGQNIDNIFNWGLIYETSSGPGLKIEEQWYNLAFPAYASYYDSCYNFNSEFIVSFTKGESSTSYIPTENDGFICTSTAATINGNSSESIITFSSLPEKFSLVKCFIGNGQYEDIIDTSFMYMIPETGEGYVSLFNEDNEPVLFKIHLENPTKQTTESQISTMSLDDKKIYRLQTRRINIEENKESTINETQSPTVEKEIQQ